MLAYRRGDFAKAAHHFCLLIYVERFATSEYAAFYAYLLVLARAPSADVTHVFRMVAEGEFRQGPNKSGYPEALAHYFFAYRTKRDDVIARWLDAYALKPNEGFAARYLPLPEKPLFK